nr:PREDICTED: 5-hydroxytryptamine receptor 3A-like [Lepisosteus oculatus]
MGQLSSEKVCSYNDVIQYLNLSKDNNLFTLTRPVKDWRDPTEVYIEVFLYAILAVSWENEFISWDPSQFCGISNISIPRELMWEPDVFIFEATDEDKSQRSPYLYILNDGTVFVEDDVRAVTSCRMNVYQFPFDTQTCNLTFGAMIHQVDTVRLIPFSNSSRATELSQQVLHSQGDWEFLGMRVLNSSFGLDRGKWDQIIYEISMKRRPELYVINFLLPIFFFLLLDIFSFFISETKGEKLGFKVTIILGISVLLLILNEILPSSSRKPPLIANFCIAIFAFMLLSLLETILITYLMEKDSASPAERGLKGCEMLSSEPSRKAETEGYQEHI